MELEWVLLRAMEKDPRRRYVSAADLARDLDRWLNGEPVVARPPSLLYRIRKRISRHSRAPALLAAALVIGIAAWVILGSEARRTKAREQAVERELAAERLRMQNREKAATAVREGSKWRLEYHLRSRNAEAKEADLYEIAHRSRDAFLEATRISPDFPDAWSGLAQAQMLVGARKEALEALDATSGVSCESGLATTRRRSTTPIGCWR